MYRFDLGLGVSGKEVQGGGHSACGYRFVLGLCVSGWSIQRVCPSVGRGLVLGVIKVG